MLNIAICDDDIQITGKIERLLQDIAKRNFVDTEIGLMSRKSTN